MDAIEFKGRHAGPAIFRPEGMTAEITEDEAGLRVRVDDAANPDFWIEFRIVRNRVSQVLEDE
jgi:hypothetical protein